MINTPAPRSYVNASQYVLFFSCLEWICHYHGQCDILPLSQNCVLHIYTWKRTCVPSVIWKCFSPTIVGIICCYHGMTFSPMLNTSYCTSTPQGQHVEPKFVLNCLWNVLFYSFWNQYAVTVATHIAPLSQYWLLSIQLNFNVIMYANGAFGNAFPPHFWLDSIFRYTVTVCFVLQ